jgi:hypothetical protein
MADQRYRFRLVVTIVGRGVGLGVGLAVGDGLWVVVGVGVWSSSAGVIGVEVGDGVGWGVSGGGVGAGVGTGEGVGAVVGLGSVDASAVVSGDADGVSSAATDQGVPPSTARPSAPASNSRCARRRDAEGARSMGRAYPAAATRRADPKVPAR